MAIVIVPEIRGQECSDLITYNYLFEPLRINITETEPLATKLYVEVERYNISDKTIPIPFEDGTLSLEKYVDIDLIPNVSVTFDLAEVMQQLHKAGVFRVATIADLETSYESMVVSQYIYVFKFTSNATEEPVIVKKLPIIGGRDFGSFNPLVLPTQPLTEFEYYGLNPVELAKKFSNYLFYKATLKTPDSQDNLQPTIETLSSPTILTPKGGVLYWKSRFGGWMFWGFDIEKRNSTGTYSGNLEVGMFESTKRQQGDPFVPVDYMEVSSTYTIELKSLSLSKLMLLALSGIDSSPVIYYAADNSGKLELMRLTNSSSPYTNLANGGDFSVTLKSISKTFQKTT